MKSIRTTLLALATAVLMAAPAAAQMQGGPLQNGTPLSPSLTGAIDPLTGLYFGTDRLGVSGHFETGAKASNIPVLSACGGVVAGDAGSTDTAGTVTQGGTVTTCTITFGTAFSVKPACIVADLTGTRASMASVASTTAITITGITASDALAWFCVAKSGG